ncbi:hypothetical protein Tco_1453168, partial [Tanacetum coccineum]
EGEYVALTETIIEPVNEDVAEKPKKLNNRLFTENGVTAAATLPFITSFVTPMPEREGGDNTDSVSGPNLRTKPPGVRFVISSDSTHHSGTHDVDVEVSSLIRSTVSDPAVLTTTVATTVVAGTSILQPKVDIKPAHASIFADSTSMGTAGPDVAGPSQPTNYDISSKSFYVSLDMDSETLHLAYVPKWDVLNESLLDEPNICRRGKKRLKGKCGMQVKLLKERDVDIADLKARLSLNEVEAAEAVHLRGQIANVEAAEAARAGELESLRERNAALESAASAKDSEVAKLNQDLASLQLSCDELSIKAFTLECEKDKLVDQVSVLEANCIDSDLMKMALHMDEEFYPRYLTTIAERRWILSRGIKLAIMKCLQSPEYMTALGGAIGHVIDKGMQDELMAGIEHEKAGKGLDDVSAYNPSAKANYVATINAFRTVEFSLLAQLESRKYASMADIMDLLRLEGPTAEAPEASQLQPSPEQLMVPIHRLEDQVVIRETSLSFSLEVAHNRAQRLRGDASARRLSLTDLWSL